MIVLLSPILRIGQGLLKAYSHQFEPFIIAMVDYLRRFVEGLLLVDEHRLIWERLAQVSQKYKSFQKNGK